MHPRILNAPLTLRGASTYGLTPTFLIVDLNACAGSVMLSDAKGLEPLQLLDICKN
jgi:hypothetical protein